ncbi:trichohyalin-like [Oncorhynchus tshawytscha]|uniref:trichohyalin-like n=1 Tax=Oncorhynchus tshawytscha TaxID=74940 RepID=UPI001C3C4565|nr:trichohyalin-like [Oncorhynchus tshawytscha]
MASGAGKAPQPPGPGSGSLNGTAADLPNIEQELYDYQMHGKMCKKIAQLTKVIYSLNTKNEEQEAALQAVSHAHQEELRRVTTGTCTEGRSRYPVQVEFESYRVQAEERDRGVEAELRRDYEEKLQALGLERQETQAQLNTAHDESLRLGRELETAGEAAQCLEEVTEEKEELKRSMEEARREERRQWEEREEEEKRGMSTVLRERVRKAEGEMEGSLQRLNESKRHAVKLQDRIQVLTLTGQNTGTHPNRLTLYFLFPCVNLTLYFLFPCVKLTLYFLFPWGVCVNVEELKGQVNKLQSRNRELELQSSGRNNDYRQHAEALASLRSEMVRAHLNQEKKRLKEQADEERRRLKEQADEERRRLKEQADEERRRLKEQVKKAIEEVMRKHAAELHNAQEALRTNQEQVCVRVQEDRRSGEEVCRRLETEREELRNQLQQATNQIWRLEGVIQQQSQGGVASETPPTCGIHCSHLREDLQHIQEEMEQQRESYEREMTGLRTDKQRLEEKVLELNQQTQGNTDRNVLEHNQENTDRNVLEHNQENTDRNVPEHNQENTDERIRSECEERLRAELKAELDAAVATSNQREQELQTQLADLQSQVERKAGPTEGHQDDSEIDRLRREVQETRDMNQRLREQLKEEPQRHTVALQALERRAQEELQTERNRLHTLHLLQLDKQGTELSQQYTEWSRQLTQRHMKHIEDLQTELHTHTEMMALQQDLKQQNQYQVFERQLDESRCAVLELQRENTVLRSGEEAMGREREQKEREEEAQRLREEEAQRLREEEAQRLREEVDRLREEVEKLEEAQKQREEQREEEMREEEAQREMEEKKRDEEKRTEEENRREEVKRREAEVEEKRKVDEEKRRKAEEEEKRRKEEEEERREEVKREHRRAMQSLVCEYSSCQAELQTRIVALETELREREERCRRREVPLCDDLQMGRLQERLTERNQLIKRLVEERHQLQLHPPVAGDNGTLRLHDNRPHPGIVTPTMRRKRVEESPPRITSVPNLSAYERSVLLPHDTPSPCLPQHPSPSSTLPYASSSLPRSSPSSPVLPGLPVWIPAV